VTATEAETVDAEGAARSEGLERRRKRRRRVLVPLVFIAPVLLLAAGVYVWWRIQLDPPGAPGAVVLVTVEKGWGVRDIADELAARDVIGSSLAFNVYVKIHHDGPFDAGDYKLQKNLGVEAAVRALARGPVITYVTLRVPPGLWISEVAKQVQRQMPGLSAAKFLSVATSDAVRSKYEPAGVHTVEGLLFPDTYKFTKDDREIDVVRTLVKRFDTVADSIGLGDPVALARLAPGRTAYQVIVVASLVQEEAGIESDRPLIASVVDNRLRDGMRLEIDATVLYALQVRKPSNTEADRATDSPYNTYKHKGLPPTPIGEVAKASLVAALHPATTDYLYYVLAGRDGHHAFASTYEEHLRNVEAARQAGLLH
jgi:peptidoglycan lytic transglycosylase G